MRDKVKKAVCASCRKKVRETHTRGNPKAFFLCDSCKREEGKLPKPNTLIIFSQ